ncbi:MAG: YCF48-related protein [Bacteroidota bacterium]
MKTIVSIFALASSILTSINVLDAQWVQQASNSPENLSDVVMLDSQKAIVIGDRNGILRTTDAGTTWVNETIHLSAVFHWNAISLFDSLNGGIAGDQSVWSTTDGGMSWKPLTVPVRQKILSILCLGAGQFYVGTDSGWVYSTSDTGRTWTGEKISAWPIRSLFTYRTAIVGVSKYALTPYSLCAQFVIPPPSWREKILPYFQGLGSEAFDAEFCNGGGAGFIVGVQGDFRAAPAILRKSMSDTSWRMVPGSVPGNGALRGVSAPSANVIYVCGDGGMLLKSKDGGDTWDTTTVPTRRNLNAVYFFDERRGFAVGDSGLILRTRNGGVTSVGDRQGLRPNVFALEQNYPNPFNPTTVIRFSLPNVGTRHVVSLKVYDVLGREVASLVSEELPTGTYTVRWNAAAFPSGVYLYQLRAGSFVETKKLVLLR